MAIVQIIDTNSAVKDNFGANRSIERSGVVGTAVDTTESVGLIRFAAGAKINDFVLNCSALDTDTTLTLKVGYIYDDTSLTSNDDAFFTALDIAQTGGGHAHWPSDSASLQVTGFEAAGDGYLAITIAGKDVDTAGTVACRATITYGDR